MKYWLSSSYANHWRLVLCVCVCVCVCVCACKTIRSLCESDCEWDRTAYCITFLLNKRALCHTIKRKGPITNCSFPTFQLIRKETMGKDERGWGEAVWMPQSFLVGRTSGKQRPEVEQQYLQYLWTLEIDAIGRVQSKYVCLHYLEYRIPTSYACHWKLVVYVCVCAHTHAKL